MPESNDYRKLVPSIPDGERVLALDFTTFSIGVAEYADGPTGCTVFHFPRGVACAVDVRGGSPGVIGDYGWTHAICLAGGSLYGLEAATGVAAELFSQREYSAAWGDIALVSGAIIYDYGSRSNTIYPDKTLGRAALRAARPGRFPLGARGAGRSARVGNLFPFTRGETAGQGGAFRQIGPTKIAAFSVVNAIGVILDRGGQVRRGGWEPSTGRRWSPTEGLDRARAEKPGGQPPGGNTTLTVIVTNQRLGSRELIQLGRQVHASMARAIQPFHTINDGDVLFAVTTADVENPTLSVLDLGIFASEVVWDAVLQCWDE